MAWSRTLTQIITDVRARADMEVNVAANDANTQFVTDTVITNWVNLAISELVGMIVNETEEILGIPGLAVKTSTPVTMTNGVDLYSLASDVFKPFGVDISRDGGANWVSCNRFPFAERNRLTNIYDRTPRYVFVGNQIMFRPIPQGGIKFRYWYIPSLTALVSGTDAFDFVNGWDDWVACRAAIRCLQKEESDTSALERDLGFIKQRVMQECAVRDQGLPSRVADVRGYLPFAFDDEAPIQ